MKKYVKPLPYGLSDLEPYMSARTVELHHSKHEAAYERNLQGLYNGDLELIDIVKHYHGKNDPNSIGIYNNAGQLINHQLYWACLCPPKEFVLPEGRLLAQINQDFGSLENLTKEMVQKAVMQFGSGWVWLIFQDERLRVVNTGNADSPLTTPGAKILLAIDVWEHSYYLDYTCERGRFVETMMKNLVNWKYAMRVYENI